MKFTAEEFQKMGLTNKIKETSTAYDVLGPQMSEAIAGFVNYWLAKQQPKEPSPHTPDSPSERSQPTPSDQSPHP